MIKDKTLNVEEPSIEQKATKPYNYYDEVVKQNKKEEEVKQKKLKNFTAKPDPSKA